MADDIDFSAYEKVFKDADRDNLVGRHNFMVTGSVIEDAWPDGRGRYKIPGALVTASNWKIELTLSALDSPQEIADTLDAKIKKSKVLNAQNWMALAKIGLKVNELKQGDTFAVETYRDKPREGYDTGFVRVRRVIGAPIDPEQAKPKGDKDVPF